MKVLIINTNESSGGAAIATNRLHKALRKAGLDSWMLVQRKQTSDYFVVGAENNLFYRGINYLRGKIDRLPLRLFYPNRKSMPLSLNWLSKNSVLRKIKKIDPDIIHLNWINGGFLSIKDVKKISKTGKPIVWTLHDMWVFTGGCHYSYNCKRYLKHCKKCPALNHRKEKDLFYWNFNQKKKFWINIDFNITTPSRWLGDCAKKSELLKNKNVTILPNLLDVELFKLLDKIKMRKKIGLPADKKIVLFGAMDSTSDSRKGFYFLKESLKRMSRKKDFKKEIVLAIFGASESEDVKKGIDFDCYFLGNIKEEKRMAEIYSACDVMVVPSSQEAFGQTASEALSCGKPVVCFRTTGLVDIVDHKKNGYLAKPFDVDDLSKGIEWCIEDEKRNAQLGKNAREKVLKEFSQEVVSQKIVSFYKKLLANYNKS